MLTIIVSIISAITVGFIIFALVKSFYSPKEGTIQIIKKFRKFYKPIMAVDGYKFEENWNIVPQDISYQASLSEQLNIYFFLWPIFKKHIYPFSYTKKRKKGEQQPGDLIVWEDGDEIVIARTGISDHVVFSAEYPMITRNLRTKGMGNIIAVTNNTFRAHNVLKMLFRTTNWLSVASDQLGGALRGIVGQFEPEKLNEIKGGSATGSDFTRDILWINEESVDNNEDGLIELTGVELKKSIFVNFKPGDEATEKLIDSFQLPKIAEKEGEARVIAQQKTTKAFVIEQKAVAYWATKNLLAVGLLKKNPDGSYSPVANANTQVLGDALKEWAKVTGTIAIGGEDFVKMLNLQK